MRPLTLATGGGTRSDFWLGLEAGAPRTDVRRVAREPGAADGAALLAMPAAGLPGSVSDVTRTMTRIGDLVGARGGHTARQQHTAD